MELEEDPLFSGMIHRRVTGAGPVQGADTGRGRGTQWSVAAPKTKKNMTCTTTTKEKLGLVHTPNLFEFVVTQTLLVVGRNLLPAPLLSFFRLNGFLP